MDPRKNKSLPASCSTEQTPGGPPSSPTIWTPDLDSAMAGIDITGWLNMYQPPSTLDSPGESTAVGIDSPCFPCAPEGDATERARTSAFLNMVKAVVVHLLNRVVYLYRKEKCYGCQVDHPSQMQHECLFPTGEYYLDRNYDEVVKRLWTVRFIPAIRDALHQNHLHVSERRVFGATEAILHNLRNTRLFEAKIEKLYEQLVENDETQMKITRAAWAFWQH